MSAYESLAACYDELTYDIRYEKTLTFFERLCAREHVQPHLVLDLACGTGSLSMLLAEHGYRVIGADLSEEMLAEAEQKARDLPEDIRPFFICQPMQRLRLAEPADAVICALDSLNYLMRPDDCRKTFRRVYDALKPGGLFVFDINTPAKLRGLDGQVFLDETDDTYCVWRTEFDAKKRLCYYGMDIFRLDGAHWTRSFEEHLEYAYEPDELLSWLQEAGFTHVRQYGDRVTRTLISLGRKELQSIVDDGKDIHIDCQFCDKIYDYTPEQVRQILKELDE